MIQPTIQKEVIAIETKCIAMGDPYCQFKVKPKSS